jgi:acetyltransferase-like isoleucine patch superfamily enzyme
MHQPAPLRPKLAETVIEATVKLRETTVGRCCEILGDTALEYTELGDYSYLGPGCMVADAQIGRFCAVAAQVRIGAPNHPLDRPSQHRFTYCPEYYTATAQRDHAFFRERRADCVLICNDVWIGHAVIV